MANKMGDVAVEFRIPVWRRVRNRWNRARERLVSDGGFGCFTPPNNWASSPKFPEGRHGVEWHMASFVNDAHEIGISTKYAEADDSEWRFILPAPIFRRLALWYVWRWAVYEWFGVRRWLYYRALRRSLRAATRQEARHGD